VPVRRLNYTSRRRIARSDVDVILRGGSTDRPSFDAALSLAAYKFPPDARVFIEAYRQTILMRFDYGTVSAPKVPDDRTLVDFPSAEEVLFRVRVTAASDRPGVLLGEADRLRFHEPEQKPDRRLPLLPAMPDDLGEEVWRVDFEGGTTLLVSRHLPDWKQTVSSDAFRAAVYPAAMRQVLERILFVEKYLETEDTADWRSRWLQFASRIPGSRAVPSARDDHDEWIENAVAAFARHFQLRTRFVADMAQQ
jgi:hypothetical protein